MANVLVTGSAGFIGHSVARRLLDGGHRVTGLDSFNEYYPPALKRARHAHLGEAAAFEAVEADLADRDVVVPLVAGGGFDAVCNLAAQTGVRHSLSHPHDYVSANLVGFLNVLEGCRQAPRPPRLVYASSSSVYGDSLELPFREDQRADRPLSLYAATKRADELMAHVYTRAHGVPTVGLRFFSVYGPWGRPDMVLWIFAEAILEGRPIQVFNHGELRRSFTYVDDIAAGVEAALLAGADLEPFEVMNLGSGTCWELTELIRILERHLGRRARCELRPAQPGDLPASWADVEQAQRKLGFDPHRTSLDEGVARFVKWYLEHPELAAEVRLWRQAARVVV